MFGRVIIKGDKLLYAQLWTIICAPFNNIISKRIRLHRLRNNVAIKKKPIELLRDRKNDKNQIFEYPLKVTHRKIALSVS